MNYFDLPSVSNSDLTKLKNELSGQDNFDPTRAFALGSLLDAMITEPHRVCYISKKLDGVAQEDFDLSRKMAKAFNENSYARMLISGAEFQKISVKDRILTYNDFEFSLSCRCKWDFFGAVSGDIKTTTAKTQKEFEAACNHFDYFRSRAWYMDIEGRDRDVIIGISKVNFKVFFVKIERGDANYIKGLEDYLELAFKYWVLKYNYK